jgi:hypothetical protein
MKVENGSGELIRCHFISDPRLQKILVLLYSGNETKFPAQRQYPVFNSVVE